MSEPVFLELVEVLRFHERSLAEFGGLHGLRDPGLLESAVMQPRNAFYYDGDLFDVAAGYAFHLAEAQAFLDGNKRTAIASALAFLHLNGVTRLLDWTQLHDAMIAIAERRMTKAEPGALLRQLAAPGM